MPKIFDKLVGKSKGPVKRRHSVFGDFVTGDTSTLPEQEREMLGLSISEYNTLWSEYAATLGWGEFPTQKGFKKWLEERKS